MILTAEWSFIRGAQNVFFVFSVRACQPQFEIRPNWCLKWRRSLVNVSQIAQMLPKFSSGSSSAFSVGLIRYGLRTIATKSSLKGATWSGLSKSLGCGAFNFNSTANTSSQVNKEGPRRWCSGSVVRSCVCVISPGKRRTTRSHFHNSW